MSDMAEFDDLKLEIQKEKKKNGNTAVLGKVRAAHSTIATSILLQCAHRCSGLTSLLCAGHAGRQRALHVCVHQPAAYN